MRPLATACVRPRPAGPGHRRLLAAGDWPTVGSGSLVWARPGLVEGQSAWGSRLGGGREAAAPCVAPAPERGLHGPGSAPRVPRPHWPFRAPSLPRSSLPRAVPGAAVPAAALVGGTVLAPSHRWGAGGTEGCHREDAGPLTAGPAPARRPRGPGPEPARPAGLRLPGGRGHELPGGAACRALGPGRSERARGRHPGLQGGRLRPGPAAQGRRGLRPPALPRAASRWEGRAPLSPPRHCRPSPG